MHVPNEVVNPAKFFLNSGKSSGDHHAWSTYICLRGSQTGETKSISTFLFFFGFLTSISHEKKINSNSQQFHKYLHNKPPSLTSKPLNTWTHKDRDITGARGTDHPPFSNFLFTNLFSIKFLYFFIISSLFPYFNLFVSIYSYNLMLTSNCMCRPYTEQWTSGTCYQLQ